MCVCVCVHPCVRVLFACMCARVHCYGRIPRWAVSLLCGPTRSGALQRYSGKVLQTGVVWLHCVPESAAWLCALQRVGTPLFPSLTVLPPPSPKVSSQGAQVCESHLLGVLWLCAGSWPISPAPSVPACQVVLSPAPGLAPSIRACVCTCWSQLGTSVGSSQVLWPVPTRSCVSVLWSWSCQSRSTVTCPWGRSGSALGRLLYPLTESPLDETSSPTHPACRTRKGSFPGTG